MNTTSSLNAYTVKAQTRIPPTIYAATATITTTGFTVPTDLPVTFIDIVSNKIVNMNNILIGRSYRLALGTNNIWSYLITHTTGTTVGFTINAFNNISNTTVYLYDNLAQTTGSFVFNGAITKFFMYGLQPSGIPYLPKGQFGTITIQ